MTKDEKYLFGPVPSRRLGLSLGVDIVPLKVCTLDCVYCQLGKSSEKITDRHIYVDIDELLGELKDRVNAGLKADYITISGSGEPTLNSQLGEIIDGIKNVTDIPVAVLTNGTLLDDDAVRSDCAKADVVLPSLDAGDEEVFEKINRPGVSITLKKLMAGLCAFREEFKGQIWLEVFFVEGFNTDNEQIEKIAELIKKIAPDKVQLNTAVRPTLEKDIKKIGADRLNKIAVQLNCGAEVVADFSRAAGCEEMQIESETVLSILKRRPCTIDDVCSSMQINRNQAIKHITKLLSDGEIIESKKTDLVYYSAK